MDDYETKEIEHIFASIRNWEIIRIQMFAFLGMANLTALGFAFTHRKSTLFIVAAITAWLLVISESVIGMALKALYCRGLQIEALCAKDSQIALLTTYLSAAFTSSSTYKELIQAAIMTNIDERRTMIRKARHSIWGHYFPLAVIFIDIGLGICTWLFLHWKWF